MSFSHRGEPYVPDILQQPDAEIPARRGAMSRRGFVKLSGVAGGGLVLALSSGIASCKPRAGAAGSQDTFSANPFVQIKVDGTIVLFAKNPEIGQGVKTSLPMIVAEELDADWQRVRVEQAPIDATRFGRQASGGSRSVPTNWELLRRAGAAARAMLLQAAAEQLAVPVEELSTANSVVTHAASGRRLNYGELAARAAGLPVPDVASVPLKSRGQYRLLGTRIGGVDNHAIVTGQPLFGIDQLRPDMVYASYLRAPTIGARVASVNLDAVKELPGVIDAFVLEVVGDPIEFDPSAPALLSGVAVLATSTWIAFQARKKLAIQWDESDASSDSWSDAITRARDLALRPAHKVLGESGSVETAFSAAHKTVEALYQYPYLAHAPLEPQNCTALVRNGNCELWAPTQTPQMAVDAVAQLLGVAKTRVTLHQTRIGGGFGRRLSNDYVCEAAAIAARAGGRPVKLQWSREEDMAFDFYRPGGFHSLKASIDGNGKLTAWQDHFITFSRDGRNAQPTAGLSATEFPANVLANKRVQQSLIRTRMPVGPWRAPGSNAIAFAMQCFLHECAIAATRDHLEFLLELMGEPRLAARANPQSLHTGRAAGVISLAAAKAGWGRELPRGSGLGLAFHYSHLGHFAEVAEVSVDAERKLKLHKVWVAADVGPIINLSGAEAQVQGSVIDGFSTALGLQITFEHGRVQQTNFNSYPILRIPHAPAIEVHFIESDYPPTGLGEPALPPVAPAIANAIFAASGHRVRTMPFSAEGYSV